MDYIEQNIKNDFSLDELADQAYFSKFHFHRIFHAFVGETLFSFIQRIRIEKAAMLLLSDPQKSVTEIAFACGFNSPAAFSRSFKKSFKISATEWRNKKQSEWHKSKMGKTISNPRKEMIFETPYIYYNKTLPELDTTPEGKVQQVRIEELPAKTVAYIRYIGPYQGDAIVFERLYSKLFSWAKPRNLFQEHTEFINLYHDDPEITDKLKLRVSAGLTIPDHETVDGEVNKMVIPGGKCACASFKLSAEQYQNAWDWMYKNWLPRSGYVPDDRLSFELFSLSDINKDCNKDQQNVDICIPVKPMGF
jgi:AraC family transcriptional regulator